MSMFDKALDQWFEFIVIEDEHYFAWYIIENVLCDLSCIVVNDLQYYSDANAAESWMKEKEPLVISEDYGHDEASANVSTQE